METGIRTAVEESSLELRFQESITLQMFIAAQTLHVGWRWLGLLLFPVVMGAWMLFGEYSELSSVSGKLASIGIFSLFPALMYWWTRRSWAKVFRASPYFKERATGLITDDGLSYSSPLGAWTIPWKQFTRARYRPELIVLYQSPVMFRILSRDFFEAEDAWRRAVEEVRRRIPKR